MALTTEEASEKLMHSLIKHDLFFSSVIDLIPTELYNHTANEEDDELVPKYYQVFTLNCIVYC
jgi:hypothetical protein